MEKQPPFRVIERRLLQIRMMNELTIAVIGATGGTGRALIENALAAGYKVVAVARRPEAVKMENARLVVRRGDVLDFDSI